jgi:RNA polymerase sigma-70 factor, ECF subfamily
MAETAAAPFTNAMQLLYPRLVRRLTLIVRDPSEAQDLAQTTMLRAYKAWPEIRSEEIGAWLFTVGTRLALNELRRRRRWLWRGLEASDRISELSGDPDLWEALGELDRRERAALILSVLEGYTQAEIAERLGVPPGTVASWLSRGKARLRARLEEVEPNG